MMPEFFYILFSDPHVNFSTLDEFDKIIRLIKLLKPPITVLCGDLLDIEGNDPGRDTIELAELTRICSPIINQLKCFENLHLVAGNHDVGNFPTSRTLGWYAKNFSDLWHVHVLNECEFIFVDSNLLKNPLCDCQPPQSSTNHK